MIDQPADAQCRCQSTSHDHQPGECNKPASDDQEGLCSACYYHLLNARTPPFQNNNWVTPPRKIMHNILETWWQPQGPLTLRVPPQLPEEHPFYTLVGRVTSEFSHFEHILDATIWDLLGGNSNLTACITSQIMGPGPRCRAIITLCRALEISESVSNPYTELMNQSFALAEKRNRIIHDYWVVGAEVGKASQFRAMSFKDPRFGLVEIEKDEIEETLKKIRKFQERATKFRAAVLIALHALQEKPA